MTTEGPLTRRSVSPQAPSVLRRRLRRLLVAAKEYHTRDVLKDACTRPASERVCEKNRRTGRARNRRGWSDTEIQPSLNTIFADAVHRGAQFLQWRVRE